MRSVRILPKALLPEVKYYQTLNSHLLLDRTTGRQTNPTTVPLLRMGAEGNKVQYEGKAGMMQRGIELLSYVCTYLHDIVKVCLLNPYIESPCNKNVQNF